VQGERALIPPSSLEKADLLSGIYRAVRAALGLIDGPLDAYGEDAQLVRNLAPLADFLHDRYWRISIEGADKLPAGPCLLVANHAGALPVDGPMLRLALARHRPEPGARWLAEESILQIPLLGALLNRIGAIRASPENALQILSDGKQLIVFPEGTHAANKSFTRRYELKPFGRGGFVKIAARAQVPIVPVAIVGAGDALPVLVSLPIQSFGLPCLPLTLPPLPTKWSIRIGEPLNVNQVDPDDATEIARCTEWARASVQGMVQDMLSCRRSIFSA
jgi:1-acyl-sn-glycerol-3-phosphate acyltransferase